MKTKRVLPENDPGDNIASRLVFCEEEKLENQSARRKPRVMAALKYLIKY